MPRVCKFVGNQLGRVVGLLQGARVRADQFTQHNELKSLQNELRSGLRELDQVKTEMAIAASSRGVMGRSLGPTTVSANKNNNSYNNERKVKSSLMSKQQISPTEFSSSFPSTSSPASMTINSNNTKNNKQKIIGIEDFDFRSISDSSDNDNDNDSKNDDHQQQVLLSSSVIQTERAVMEEEWEKQGIGFRSRAEQGLRNKNNSNDNDNDDTKSNSNSINRNIYNNLGSNDDIIIKDTTRATGSELLEHLERQVLIFDQYDRVVGEQEKQMEQRINRIQKERKEK